MAENTLNRVRKLVGFPDLHWQRLCMPLIDGISHDDLERLRKIMVVRQSFYLPPGAAAEDIYRDRDLWTYATLVTSIKKMGYNHPTPKEAESWLFQDEACERAIQFALLDTPSGILHEIFVQAFGETEIETSSVDTENVQTEQNEKDTQGTLFFSWLKNELNAGHIQMSARGSMVHAVEEGIIIVSPKAFKSFDSENWELVQQEFVKLDIFEQSEEQTWKAGEGIFIKGYLVDFSYMADVECEIEINYDLEPCA